MQTINLNIQSGAIPPVVHVSQCDIGRQIDIILYDGDETYTVPDGAVVSVSGTKFDGHPFNYDSANEPSVVTYSGSTVTVYTTQQMTASAGKATCELKIKSGSTVLYTLNFVMDVETSATPQNKDLSNMDVPAIVRAIEAGDKVDELDEKLKEATEVVDKAEQIVAETATNAETAKNSATAAATSETNAKASEQSASASASSAQSNAQKASASATSASNSATSASNSATSAQESAEKAQASEASVEANATAAATSEANAKTSETNAAASAQAAKNSQSSASGYATQAKNQATNAQTSATNAASSEANAQTSATSAAQSASEAKASAENNEKWAKQSESYAVGGTSTRTGEDEDNSKYYKDLAKQYAAQAQAAVTGVSFTIVTSLPATGADGVFYLIAHEHGSGDSYDEYVWLKDQQKFERIGTTDVDLTDYVKRSDTATTAQAGTMSASDKAKLDGIATGATKVTVDSALSSTSSNPVSNKVIQSALDAIEENVNTKADASTVSTLSNTVATKADTSTVTALATKVDGKANKATTLSGYGITDGAKASDLSALSTTVASKADTSTVTALSTKVDGKADSSTVTTLQTEVNARPATRKLSTQTLTAEGGTLTWTDSCITDDSLIDVYASIPNIAPSAIEQTGTTVTVTFDAQDSAFSVAIVVMN